MSEPPRRRSRRGRKVREALLGYLLVAVTDLSIDGRFVWPVVLVALGGAGVATAVKANQREEQQFPARVPADDQI